MKNLAKYFSKNKKKIEIIKELKDADSVTRMTTSKTSYFGKINSYDNTHVVLLPYAIWDSLPQENGKVISRGRIETEIGLPLEIKEITPEKMSEDYLEQLVVMSNYFNFKSSAKKEVTANLFQGHPFPNEDYQNFLEGKMREQKSENKNLYSENRIGFKIKNSK